MRSTELGVRSAQTICYRNAPAKMKNFDQSELIRIAIPPFNKSSTNNTNTKLIQTMRLGESAVLKTVLLLPLHPILSAQHNFFTGKRIKVIVSNFLRILFGSLKLNSAVPLTHRLSNQPCEIDLVFQKRSLLLAIFEEALVDGSSLC